MKTGFPKHRSLQESASTTITVMGLIVLISVAFSAVLTRSMSTYRQVNHIASWKESLLAAEAGSETALYEMRRTIISNSAFQGWTKLDASGNPNGVVPANAGLDILKPGNFPAGGMRLNMNQLIHGGEGNTQQDAEITIDAPPELIDGSKRQWFRLRATGTTYLPGSRAITDDKRDHNLRRLSFVRNPKTNKDVSRPESTRRIEVIAKPVSFESAITSNLPLLMNNHQILVDSYDSRYSTSSTNGLYDPAKALSNGDIATNSTLIDAGYATVRGDAFTNQGTLVNGANVTGEVRDDFYLDLPKVYAPTWPTGTYTTAGGTTTTFTATSKDQYNPTQVKMGGSGKLTVTGGALNFVAPATALPGEEYYLDLWVPQDFSTSGNGSIVVAPNTNVRFFVEGNIDIKGNGSFNPNSQPGRLQILCCTPVPYAPRAINVGGNGIIVAAIYGPDHDVVFASSGSGGQMWGSITGRSISMGSAIAFHYDEALADTGYILDYQMRSWFEDSK